VKLGRCLICNERVKKDDLYITAEEGYAHTACIKRIKRPKGVST